MQRLCRRGARGQEGFRSSLPGATGTGEEKKAGGPVIQGLKGLGEEHGF